MKPKISMIAAFFFLMTASNIAIANSGTVRIDNRHPFVVEVHSQTYDYYGQPMWVHVGNINPNSYIVLPNVPVNALLGLQTQGARYVWTPFRVYYPDSYQPFAYYAVPPMN